MRKPCETFGLTRGRQDGPVQGRRSRSSPATLSGILAEELAPIASGINTEQARREYIIFPDPDRSEAPVRDAMVNVLPGVHASRSIRRQGLTGYLRLPHRAVVERSITSRHRSSPSSKPSEKTWWRDSGQCAAEMVAIQFFNERDGRPTPVVHGCVTSGSNWRFLRLQGKDLFIDVPEYYPGRSGQDPGYPGHASRMR